jgi:hypothetical protein
MNNYSPSTLATWKAGVTQATQAEFANQFGLSSGSVTVTVPTPTVDANGLRRVHVSTAYTFSSVVPWPLLPRTLNLTSSSEMRLVR